jgi:hypothetical protein
LRRPFVFCVCFAASQIRRSPSFVKNLKLAHQVSYLVMEKKMKPKSRFSQDVLATIQKEKILGIRAGRDSTHRIIGLWVVVVEGRVFVRSWSLKPRSWWRTFLEDSYGSVFIGEREIPIRAAHTRSERLKALVSRAYKEKYNTPGSVQFVKDMSRKKSRDTTTELIPL